VPAASAVLYRDAALADHSDRLTLHQSALARAGRIGWIRPDGRRRRHWFTGGRSGRDASGSTIVPGLVDAASHLTMPGGAPWIERALDPPDQLVAVAERNGELLTQAGVRWARDVGSPHAVDACMADQLGL